MQNWLEVRHQVAIAGKVKDAQTESFISGAMVRIVNGPAEFMARLEIKKKQYGVRWIKMIERFDQTRSETDGHFHFVDLFNGQYTLEASLPYTGSRFDTVQATATVTRDSQENINMVYLDLELAPTTIKGLITGPDGQGGTKNIVLAEMRIKGSGEQGFSDTQGLYMLSAIETGNREIVVSASGYETAIQAVVLSNPGDEVIQDFVLVLKT